MDAQMAESVARQRFQMQCWAGSPRWRCYWLRWAFIACFSYLVAAGRGEIGIRMALGAQPLSVFRMIAGRRDTLVRHRAALGLAGCLAMRPIVASLLFGIGPSDPSRWRRHRGIAGRAFADQRLPRSARHAHRSRLRLARGLAADRAPLTTVSGAQKLGRRFRPSNQSFPGFQTIQRPNRNGC